MNIVFTIVAKNYLALAKSLGDTVKRYNSDLDFYIVVADSVVDDLKEEEREFNFLSIHDLYLNESEILDMAFKYDVTEFCTAIKPFCFEYFIKKFEYTKLIYFDPDIYLYRNINFIYELLENKLCIVTPHYFTPETRYTGIVPEELILFVGIYNFGFFAFNANHQYSAILIDWWKNRLIDKCYADKIDALHTDQKWMDYLVAYFKGDVHILNHLGCNVAIWNLHERMIKVENGVLKVQNRISNQIDGLEDLYFMHFAGFDFFDHDIIHKHFPEIRLSQFPELQEIYAKYRENLQANNFEKLIKIQYWFSKFYNDVPISKFQRRLYRSLVKKGYRFENPFEVKDKSSFFNLLKKNGLLLRSNNSSVDKLNERNFKGFNRKVKVLNGMMKVLKLMLGFENYSLLLKFGLRYLRPENQIFLIKGVRELDFINENR